MTKDEALKLALEGLEWFTAAEQGDEPPINKTITAIKEALAQPEQEPVVHVGDLNEFTAGYLQREGFSLDDPLYAHPPQRIWVGLTDEEMHECWGDPLTPLGMKCARAIEAKLKEKNT